MRGKTRIAKIAFALFDDFQVTQNCKYSDVILTVGSHRILFRWREALGRDAKTIYKDLSGFKRLHKV